MRMLGALLWAAAACGDESSPPTGNEVDSGAGRGTPATAGTSSVPDSGCTASDDVYRYDFGDPPVYLSAGNNTLFVPIDLSGHCRRLVQVGPPSHTPVFRDATLEVRAIYTRSFCLLSGVERDASELPPAVDRAFVHELRVDFDVQSAGGDPSGCVSYRAGGEWHEGSLMGTQTRDSSRPYRLALPIDASDVDMLAVAGQSVDNVYALEFSVGEAANDR